jgi:hypothetical protein
VATSPIPGQPFRCGDLTVDWLALRLQSWALYAPSRKKNLGLLKGKINVPDDFNAPLDVDTLASIPPGSFVPR